MTLLTTFSATWRSLMLRFCDTARKISKASCAVHRSSPMITPRAWSITDLDASDAREAEGPAILAWCDSPCLDEVPPQGVGTAESAAG